MSEESGEALIPLEAYVSAGVHIGTYVKTKPMRRFIYKVRPDGLYILDVRKTDERIRIAAKFLASFPPEEVLAVTSRYFAMKPLQKFGEVTRIKVMVGRFYPGTLTNPKLEYYQEPSVLFVSDVRADRQAVSEAIKIGIPIVALCDADSRCTGVDLIIPCNNKGRKALALVYWLLARQILRERGELAQDQDLDIPVSEFEASKG